MRARPPALLILATISMALSSQAFAKTIYASGDWSLDDSQPGVQGKGNCVAATATYLGNYGAYSLNVVLDKSGAHPMELLIRPFKSPSKVANFRVTIESGRTYTFVKLPRTAKGEDTFWNLPRGTDKFIAELKASAQLNVDASGGMGELPFSLSGATAVLTQLEKRCVASPGLNSVQFEKAFLPQEVNTVDVAKVDPVRAGLLRDIVTKAVEAYHNIDKMNAELAALEARYAKLNQEKATLTAALDQLSNRDLPALITARNNAQTTIDKATADIVTLKASIASQEALLVSAQAAYEIAYANLKPFIPEHDRLLSLKQSDESRQSSAENGLANVEQNIATKTQDLADRNAESDRLRGELDRNVDETRRARMRLAEAESALRSFDPNFEIRRRKSSDRRLGALENEIQVLAQNVRTYQQQAAAAESDRAARDQAVRACEGARSASAIQLLVNRALASADDANGGRGERGGRGGNGDGNRGDGPGRGGPRGPGAPSDPVHPAPPAPVPAPVPVSPAPPATPSAPDCTAQRNELAAAIARLNTANQSLAQSQNALQARSSEKDGLERQIEQDVYRQRDEIVRREADARRYVASLESRRDQMDTRLRDLNQYVIPSLQNELSNLQSQRSASIDELEAAKRAVARSTDAYRSYKAKVNYDALDAQVTKTAARVSAIQQEIARLKRSVKDNEQLIKDQTVLRDSLDKRIIATNETIAQKTARLGEVNALLVPYNADRKVADDKIGAAKQVLADISKEYAAQLPQTAKR